MSIQDEEFNTIQFEKRLSSLKDSQDVINATCRWCLDNRQHHKKIVNCWLNVLKRVKIEQRLNLFYLANDVIQYSKRKHYEFVDSWGTALQKATTLVRDDKVKHKIVRIFNIWQQRGVYNEEFISDLCGLISVVPSAPKSDEPHEFQSNYVINKIKQCARLESDTDAKLKMLNEHNPKIPIDAETLCVSLKERAHVDDVEKELETYVSHLEGYINALKAEIKCRITNISVLRQANTQLDKDKKDVKVVANAYKVFGNKIKAFQKKLDDHKDNLCSPVPSPDVDAPSPSPDCDIELPDDTDKNNTTVDYGDASNFSVGYYNPVPVPPPTSTASLNFVTNGFTSYINSYNLQNINRAALFTNADANNSTTVTNSNYSDLSNQSMEQPPPPPSEEQFNSGHLPLLPPPLPPAFNDNNYNHNYDCNSGIYSGVNDEYNPEQEPENWEDESWSHSALDTDTPESPPLFEREGYVEGVEYHDSVRATGVADVDHRVLTPIKSDLESRSRQDVDHRNLISLTGSPGENVSDASSTQQWSQSHGDQDYRTNHPQDQDYRLPAFNLEQLKLPPPPPPPPTPLKMGQRKNLNQSPRKTLQDNVESIDMELSEEEEMNNEMGAPMLKPPPPFPDLPDDVDANSFLDDLENDLNSGDFTANLQDPDYRRMPPQHNMSMPPPPPPLMGFPAPPPPPEGNHWMGPMMPPPPPPPPQQNFFPNRGMRGGPMMRGPRGGRGRGGNYRPNNGEQMIFNRGRGYGRGRIHKRGNNNPRGNFQGGY